MDEMFQAAVTLMKSYPGLWGVCGGWGIDLFLDRQTREHKDLDVTIPRTDQLILQKCLQKQGWTLQKVVAGELLTWTEGEYLTLPVHNVWCSHSDFPPHYLEVLFSEVKADVYHFRRKQTIQRKLEQAFIASPSGIPILAPEIILLFKAKYSDSNPAYEQDFELTREHLTIEQKIWLKQALRQVYGDHAWLRV